MLFYEFIHFYTYFLLFASTEVFFFLFTLFSFILNPLNRVLRLFRAVQSSNVAPNLDFSLNLDNLPENSILLSILEYLKPTEVIHSLGLVSKHFHTFVKSADFYWKCQSFALFGFSKHLFHSKKVKIDHNQPQNYFFLFRSLRNRSSSIRKKILYSNLMSVKSREMRRKEFLGKQLNFTGFYTNGGCDGVTRVDRSRFWIDNLFAEGLSSNYCSSKGDSIEVLAKYLPFEGELKRKREKNRRKALLWIFKGSKLPLRLLNLVDNVELESLLLEAIENNVDELVKVKCIIWQKNLNSKNNLLFTIKKFFKIYNSFRRPKTKDFCTYIRTYVNLKGILQTILFSCKLLLSTCIKYVHFINHTQRLNKVLQLSQRKVKFKNGLLAIRNKVLKEREMIEKNLQHNFVFPEITNLTENEEILVDVKSLKKSCERFCLIKALVVSRKGSFTSPLSTGAVMSSSFDFQNLEIDYKASILTIQKQEKTNEMSNALMRAVDYSDVKEAVAIGVLPPIVSEYRCKTVHVVEFEATGERVEPLIWFTFDSKVSTMLPFGLRRHPRRNLLSSKLNYDFVYTLYKPRLAKGINLKLIEAKSSRIQTNNIDLSSVSFYGHDLEFVV